MNFFKTVFASCLGSVLALLVGFFLIFIIFSSLASMGGGESEPTVTSSATVLRISLDEPIIERHPKEGALNIDPMTLEPKVSLGLNRILKSIRSAQEDANIEGIYLNISSPVASMSTLEDIRNALVEFKESGKWIVAYSESMSQKAYWINSVADEVYLYPEGGLDWSGLNAELTFFKNMLDKVGVDVQIIRGPDNKFKSAVEPFMYDEMSDANREQLTEFVSDFWRTMKNDIADSRGLSPEQLQSIANDLKVRKPKDAMGLGMVNGLKYADEISAILKTKLGVDQDGRLNFLELADYVPKSEFKLKADKVAVVYAVGQIESGEGDDATIGSDRIAEALRQARLDDGVKAVVLRVNSPGGSALASDVIWRETQLIKEAGKPFVVSMGDVAASGGYYIAAYADTIFANPTTITGSIGVFGILPNAQELLEEKVGITFDEVSTAEHAGFMSVTQPLDSFEMSAIQESVVHIYETFLNKVAVGRGMTRDQVDAIGQGRVWTGEDALEIGLVDQMGNLEDAITCAAGMANMGDYRIKALPKQIDPLEQLLQDLSGQKTQLTLQAFGEEGQQIIGIYKDLMYMSEQKGVQARMPFYLEIK